MKLPPRSRERILLYTGILPVALAKALPPFPQKLFYPVF
jgi:hypothetical protein